MEAELGEDLSNGGTASSQEVSTARDVLLSRGIGLLYVTPSNLTLNKSINTNSAAEKSQTQEA